MQLFRTLIFLCFILNATSAFTQVKIHGAITYNDVALTDAVVEKYINGKRSVDVIPNSKGKYSVELPLNVRAEFVFKSDKKLPVKFIVDTYPQSKGHSNTKEYDVPFDIDLFGFYPSIEMKFDPNTAFGEILMDGVGSETFSFHPNDKMIKHLLDYKEASKTALKKGEKPSEFEPKIVAKPAINPALAEVVKSQQAQDVANKSQQSAGLKTEAGDKITEAKNSELENSKSKVASANQQNEKSDFAKKDTQTQNKQTKAEAYIDQNKDKDSAIDMRVNRNLNAEELAEAGGVVNQASKNADRFKLIKESTNSQTFYTDKVLTYEKNGVQNTLMHTIYNWMLFTSDYYYLNGVEITKEKYEIERKQVLK